ncbi:DEAD/DEAH box helicase [Bacillus thermocopriae]|uniref:DEAD/DEAH box helicase n=1 Tax=Neobacillus thermocopriae TaxID=1215031 RepID=A0A6B3TM16_9BACI|nr:DEAD/DEAH box helicase [Neobacillus thermocopriae]NEX77923.1 DEAD/DEAH box helicase [Neobacillus thermocopriae]
MGIFVDDLKVSLHKGFIDQRISKTGNYRPKLLVNNPRNGENVLNTLLDELESCESFFFSVAFITESGLATLKSHFLNLKRKGVKGRILTSTFLNFNQPKVFKELMKIENVEVRTTNLEGFHSKGYIFNQRNHYSLIVGSSNLTAHALKVNYEWNVKLTSHENGEIVYHFKNQFEEVWNEAHPLNEEWIELYEKRYTPLVHRKALDQVVELPSQYNINSIEEALKIKPNKMQEAALQGIQAIRDAGAKKGLVISTTGTGKTYLSAFDVRRFRPKRMLFIVHREQILQKAKEDYKKVLGGIESDFGILSGTSKQTNAKYLFATIQSISKEETLAQFDSKEFDYILIDEVHKAGAHSYQKVIDYFNPDFLMGMTATPERTDDYNIFKLFDYNIAYEIRLQEALEEDMLCPFHYFGVTDLEYNGELIDETAVLSKLVTEERVNHILEKIHYYGFSGEKVKGLMFCSRKEEAKKLANAFNEKGLRTVALVGDHSQEERDRRVKQLEEGLLDYIITVDIFNEGIDIPSVNQVVMLRQTQSSIIFIQQLGRGLRKHPTKEYVTIIDFIGNYKNNYLIPIALSGDKSHSKDKLRRCIKDTSYIKGVSTINFEEIAKKQIFKAINNSNLTALKVLKEAFVELKNRIGRIPYLYDFVVNHSIDPEVIVTKHTNYYQFLLKLQEEVPLLSKYENSVLTMLSMEILNGKRKHEIILMDLLLQQETVKFDDYIKHLIDSNCLVDDKTLSSVLRVFSLEFFTQSYKEKYGNQPIILNVDGIFTFNDVVRRSLNDNPFFKILVKDVIKSAREKSMHYKTEVPLTLYQKYSRKDVCKLLNWSNDESSTLYGYKTKHGTCPIFVTYYKKEDVGSSIDYADEFLSPEVLKWATRSNRTLESQEVKTIIESEEKGIELHIFVKKDDDEGTDFYYLGKATPDKNCIEQVTMEDGKGKKLPVVHMNLVMENPIETKLYSYIINGTN